jgi:sigma-B regulation protein RsbU (phosphoserine phosphatase)
VERPTLDAGAVTVHCSTSISSTSGPSKDGGDFAESFTLPNASVAIGVWDASGNGADAAPDMMLVRAGFRAVLNVDGDIVTTVGALNRVLYRQVRGGETWPFVAGFFSIVDPVNRTLHYVSCGHEAAIVFRTAGSHVHLAHNSPLLGLDETANFREDTIKLQHGDTLVVVTDGVTEARPLNSPNNFFGSRRICSLFETRRTEYVTDASGLMSYVVAFSDGALKDDAAILIARFT